MTMILTCLTKGFVIQTSDRRISTVVDRKVQWYDDISNKALVYKKQFVFAYTGQAKIPVKKDGQNVLMSTIDWAAEQLKNGRNLDEAVNNLKFRATELTNSKIIWMSLKKVTLRSTSRVPHWPRRNVLKSPDSSNGWFNMVQVLRISAWC